MNQEVQKGIRINKKAESFIKRRMKELGFRKFKTFFMLLLEKDGYNINHEDV